MTREELKEKLILEGFSPRESDVIQEVCKGITSKEVANNQFISEKTVKFHLTNIYRKKSLKNRPALILWVNSIKQQLLPDEQK